MGEPYPVGMSAVSNWSLRPTGTPWSGPLGSKVSPRLACARASSGSRNSQARTTGSRSSIRSRHALTSSEEEISPDRILPAVSTAEGPFNPADTPPSSHDITGLSRRPGSSGEEVVEGLRLRRPGRAPAHEQVDGPRHEGQRDRVVQVVQKGPNPLPVLAEEVAEVGQGEDPRHAPQQRVEGKPSEVHPGGTGRERDEGAHHRQTARDEDRELSVIIEPFFGDLEVILPHPDVAAVAQPQLPPAEEADEVSDPGANEVPQ